MSMALKNSPSPCGLRAPASISVFECPTINRVPPVATEAARRLYKESRSSLGRCMNWAETRSYDPGGGVHRRRLRCSQAIAPGKACADACRRARSRATLEKSTAVTCHPLWASHNESAPSPQPASIARPGGIPDTSDTNCGLGRPLQTAVLPLYRPSQNASPNMRTMGKAYTWPSGAERERPDTHNIRFDVSRHCECHGDCRPGGRVRAAYVRMAKACLRRNRSGLACNIRAIDGRSPPGTCVFVSVRSFRCGRSGSCPAGREVEGSWAWGAGG